MPRTRPPYPLEFRREAIKLLRSGARTPKQLAAELGCRRRATDVGRRDERPAT